MDTYAKIKELEQRIERLECGHTPLAGVDFASDEAAEAANKVPGLTAADLDATSAGGVTVEDVQKAGKRKK